MATPARRPGAPARGQDTTTSRQSDAGKGARFALLSAFYAGVAYVGFLALFLHTVGFVSGAAVPRTIDSGGPRSNTAIAVVIDGLLLALFAVQHTAMADGLWS
jgi:methanethiol S-methyltransferase